MELKLLSILDEDYLWELGYQRNVDYEIQLDDLDDLDNPSIILCMKDENNKFTCRLYITEDHQIYLEGADLYNHLYTNKSIVGTDLKWAEYSYGKEYDTPAYMEKLPISDLFFISKQYYRKLYPAGGKIVQRLERYNKVRSCEYGEWKLNCNLTREEDEHFLKENGYSPVKDEKGRYFLLENCEKVEVIRYLTAYYKLKQKTVRDVYADSALGDDILYEYSRREYTQLFDIFHDSLFSDDEEEDENEEEVIDLTNINPYPFPTVDEMGKYFKIKYLNSLSHGRIK